MVLRPNRGLLIPERGLYRPRGFRREDYERSRIERAPFQCPNRRIDTPLEAAVAYDNSLTAKNATNNTAWSSGNLAVGSLTNACAVVVYAWANTAGTPRTVSTMKLDVSGASFTLLNGVALSFGASRPEVGVAIYYLAGASLTNANHTADAVMSGTTRWKAGLFLTAQGVDQTTPMAGFVSDTTDITSPNALSPTGGTANDLDVGGLLDFDGSGTATMGASTNTTQRGTTQTDTAIFGLMFIGGTAPGNAATAGFTFTAAVANACVFAVLKAVAAGGSPPYVGAQSSSFNQGGVQISGGRR